MLRLACGVKAFFYICVIHWVFFVKLFSKDFKLISLLYFPLLHLMAKIMICSKFDGLQTTITKSFGR